MEIFVINLERSVQRRKSITSQLDVLGLQYKIVPAVDGQRLTDSRIREVCRENYLKKWKNKGHIACSLSHHTIYKEIINRELPFALVLEDDVTLSKDLPHILDSIEKYIKPDEIILFHTQTWNPLEVCNNDKIQLTDQHFLHFLLPPKGSIGSSAAYIVPYAVAKNLADKMLPIFTHPDGWVPYLRMNFAEYLKCIFPFPVTPTFAESDIQYIKGDSVLGRLKKVLNRLPLIKKIMALRRKIQWKKSHKQIFYVDKPPIPASILYREFPMDL